MPQNKNQTNKATDSKLKQWAKYTHSGRPTNKQPKITQTHQLNPTIASKVNTHLKVHQMDMTTNLKIGTIGKVNTSTQEDTETDPERNKPKKT